MSTTASGRPVRFFILLMGGWATIRVASGMLGSTGPAIPPSPQAKAPAAAHTARYARATVNSPAEAAATPTMSIAGPAAPGHPAIPTAPRLLAHAIMIPLPGTVAHAMPTMTSGHAAPAATQAVMTAATVAAAAPAATQDTPSAVPLAPPAQPRADRWRGSAWLLWREGSATPANTVTAGRLGGSQAGLRIDYDLTPQAPGRTALYGRVTTALNSPASPEGAVGLAWQPSRSIPISLAAERRIKLGKGARNANALMAVGGFGPTPLTPGLEAEAYAQAGMVGFHSRDLFVDGKFSLLSPIARSPLRLGASLSGGAQPGVQRLDIGPEAQIRLPLPHLSTRLSVEWRERIAGHAAPSSGLAVTLGADF